MKNVWYLGFALLAILLLAAYTSIGRNPKVSAAGAPYALVFADEFDGTTLDTNKWNTCYPWPPNDCLILDGSELQYFLAENAYPDGQGHLQLKAERRNFGGRNYVSGMVNTYNSFSFKFGYAEARLKLPAGQGLWPAFWMLPINDGAWPDDEIDVMENLGHEPTRVYMTYHWPDGNSAPFMQYNYAGPNFSAGWHTFAVDWQPNAIVWYIDGIERARYTDAAHITSKRMFLFLTFAVGGPGSWPGPPNGSTPFPSYYQVDYVRVWAEATPSYHFLPVIQK